MRGVRASPPAAFEAAAREILDRRLRTDTKAPVALGLSGGGDSTALALIAADWAKSHGRPLLILTVDHRLRAESALWSERCRRFAERLGADFRALTWEGDKPLRGLPAAARTARHGLLAEAAREAGASVILLGHTLDDVMEAARMRAAGSTTPTPREWAPSPAWPEGRRIFLLRPLLATGREEIRARLRSLKEAWIEDPANGDLTFARARARATPEAEALPAAEVPEGLADLAQAVRADSVGTLTLQRESLRHPAARPFLAMAALCAAGTSRPPRTDSAERLVARLAKGGALTTTLCGARIEADAEVVRLHRDAGEAERGGLASLAFGPGVAVWDGRFELTADQPTVVRGVDGLRGRLPRHARAALAAFPPKVREGLPVVIERDGGIRLLLPSMESVIVRPLAHERLLAACGAVAREP